MINYDAIDRRIGPHKLDEDAATCVESVRDAARKFMVAVAQVVPEGREHSLALTKIEEAMFWANAGIAREGSDG